MIFIDPGYGKRNKCAYAGFVMGHLNWVEWHEPFPQPDAQVYVELPQQRGRRTPVKMSTLIMLAFVGGQAGGPGAIPVTVAEWKGSARKAFMHKRAREKVLSEAELAVIDSYEIADDLRHNIMDAVCGGLVMLRRM